MAELGGAGTHVGVCDACGWAAAFGAMIAFGSFGAPVKSKIAKSLDIDPLVFQSYKTIMVFLTCWFILLTGEEFIFTPWGIVSGLFWVPGGVATIFAVKNAGLAIAFGVLSSFIVLVSFTWGIFVFKEHVHSVFGACLAVGCMMLGLVGMAYYSAPTVVAAAAAAANIHHHGTTTTSTSRSGVATTTTYHEVLPHDEDDEEEEIVLDHGENETDTEVFREDEDDDDEENAMGNVTTSTTDSSTLGTKQQQLPIVETILSDDDDDGVEPTLDELDDDNVVLVIDESSSSTTLPANSEYMIVCGMKWKRRTLGIMSATFTGVYGGSIMAPMRWAPQEAKGLGYLISFAIGASIITIFLWILRYLYLLQYYSFSFSRAYYELPSFHLQKMWLHGGAVGLMWSIGNVFSIVAVDYLGEGVGYSATQTAMLVSGLWGIFYFKEIEGTETITKWFLSALVTLMGILLLSYEHHEK